MLGTGIGWPTIYHKEEAMADVIIRVSKNGPYEVEGGAKLFDHQGKEYQEDQFPPLYLCRCGQSKTSPFAMAATTPRALKLRRPQASQEELGELLTTVPFPGLSETLAT